MNMSAIVNTTCFLYFGKSCFLVSRSDGKKRWYMVSNIKRLCADKMEALQILVLQIAARSKDERSSVIVLPQILTSRSSCWRKICMIQKSRGADARVCIEYRMRVRIAQLKSYVLTFLLKRDNGEQVNRIVEEV